MLYLILTSSSIYSHKIRIEQRGRVPMSFSLSPLSTSTQLLLARTRAPSTSHACNGSWISSLGSRTDRTHISLYLPTPYTSTNENHMICNTHMPTPHSQAWHIGEMGLVLCASAKSLCASASLGHIIDDESAALPAVGKAMEACTHRGPSVWLIRHCSIRMPRTMNKTRKEPHFLLA